MLLPPAVMQQAAADAEQQALANPACHGIPNVPPGVVALFPEFHQLALILQRESLPVPYTQLHNYRKLKSPPHPIVAQYYQNCAAAIAANQPSPAPPSEHLVFRHSAAAVRSNLKLRSTRIRNQMDVLVNLIVQYA